MKFCIITLGCKVNSYESEYIREKFLEKGYTEVGIKETPNIIIVNTCSVTNQSDAKSRHMISRAKRSISTNGIVIACGCSAQNHKEELIELGADIVLGTKDKTKILEYIEEFKKTNNPLINICNPLNRDFESMTLKSEASKTRAFVKIQDGCNNYCSYCIIPYLRGNIRSKDLNEAIDEINDLVEKGHKEIVLTGIHTGSYGRGLGYDLVDLIRQISKNPKLERIRISSIEITELDDKFLNELKTNPKLCDHLHIPLQAGSNLVLKKMNRKYDLSFFENKINEIRSIRPNISITTDLIVGFPYETEEEFKNTLDTLKKFNFTKIHTFPFSLRNGTLAETMKEHFVDERVKKERVHQVLELSSVLECKYYEKFIGKKLTMIVETSKDMKTEGHTDNYILVKVNEFKEVGEVVPVYIDKVIDGEVLGHVEKM